MKWEYRVLEAESEGREGASFRFSHWNYVTPEDLDAAGSDGWEAVSATYDPEGSGILFVLLKRPILDEILDGKG